MKETINITWAFIIIYLITWEITEFNIIWVILWQAIFNLFDNKNNLCGQIKKVSSINLGKWLYVDKYWKLQNI